MDGNALTGALPTELGRVTALSSLEVDDDPLSGMLPTELGTLTGLEDLNLFKPSRAPGAAAAAADVDTGASGAEHAPLGRAPALRLSWDSVRRGDARAQRTWAAQWALLELFVGCVALAAVLALVVTKLRMVVRTRRVRRAERPQRDTASSSAADEDALQESLL